MIHIDKNGDVIGSFDAPQGHGMDVDADGFVYLGQETVRKYDPATGELVGEIARTPEREGGARVGLPPWPPERAPGEGGRGPVGGAAGRRRLRRRPGRRRSRSHGSDEGCDRLQGQVSTGHPDDRGGGWKKFGSTKPPTRSTSLTTTSTVVSWYSTRTPSSSSGAGVRMANRCQKSAPTTPITTTRRAGRCPRISRGISR